MDVLTFISHIAWPLVALAMLFFGPWSVRRMSGHLRSVKKDKDGILIEFEGKEPINPNKTK